MYVNKRCYECGTGLAGRTDKKFCDQTCRSSYHNSLYREETVDLRRIDKIMRRNRRILQTHVRAGRSRIHRILLTDSGFDFNYFTHFQEGKRGKQYRFCYEYGYHLRDGDKIELLGFHIEEA